MALPIGAIDAISASGSVRGVGPLPGGSPASLARMFGDADASFGAVGLPDAPSTATPSGSSSPASFAGIMKSVAETGRQLGRAQSTEAAFAHHVPGVSIQDVIIERSKADVLLKVASAAASKASQAASTLLNMQM